MPSPFKITGMLERVTLVTTTGTGPSCAPPRPPPRPPPPCPFCGIAFGWPARHTAYPATPPIISSKTSQTNPRFLGFLGLGAADRDGVFARLDGAVALIVDGGYGAGIDFEGDGAAYSGLEGYALKAGERVDGCAGDWRFEVGFDDFISRD